MVLSTALRFLSSIFLDKFMKLSPFAIILKTHILYVFDAFKRINKFSWMLSLNLKAQTKKHQGIEQVLLNHLTQQFLQILKDFFSMHI